MIRWRKKIEFVSAKGFLRQTRRDRMSEGGVLNVRRAERMRKQRSMAQKERAEYGA